MAGYPSISLPAAIERLERLYNEEGTHAADRETVALAIGYSSRNGASDAVIAALIHYGLLDETANRNLKISTIGLDILLHDPGEQPYYEAVTTAAVLPELYKELFSEFGSSGFSDRNLNAYLVKRGFTQGATVKIIKGYRDTIEMIQRQSPPTGRRLASHSQEEEVQNVPRHTQDARSSMPNTGAGLPPVTGERRWTFQITDDIDGTISFPEEADPDVTYEALKDYIAYMELRRRKKGGQSNNTLSGESETSSE